MAGRAAPGCWLPRVWSGVAPAAGVAAFHSTQLAVRHAKLRLRNGVKGPNIARRGLGSPIAGIAERRNRCAAHA